MLNQSDRDTELTEPEIQFATFTVCLMLLVPIIILGTSLNVVATFSIMQQPKMRKTYSTIVHLLFLATAACGFVCPLELVQLIENYFHVGLMGTCVLKVFLRILLQVATFSCSVIIAWQRMQKIRGHTKRAQCLNHKYLLFSFMWLIIIPYALYNLVHSMYQDVPQLLVQACQVKHVIRGNSPQVVHQLLLPLLFLISLTSTGIIYKQGCLKAQAKLKKATANLNNTLTPYTSVNSTRKYMFSLSSDRRNRGLDLTPEQKRKDEQKSPKQQNSTMNVNTEQRKKSQVQHPPTVELETPTIHSNRVGTLLTENDPVPSPAPTPPKTEEDGCSPKSAFRNTTALDLLPEEPISTILEIPDDQSCLKPLRHTRRTAGSSWRAVRDAFESKRIKGLSEGSDNKVKRLKPILTKSDSSWSLESFMEPTEPHSKMKKNVSSKRNFCRNSQKWQLQSMSNEVDTMTDLKSIIEENTFRHQPLGNIGDDSQKIIHNTGGAPPSTERHPLELNVSNFANMQLHKMEYKHLPAVNKRNVFKSLKSSGTADGNNDIPAAWASQLQINTSILQCEQTLTEKVVPENLVQPDPRTTDEAFCTEQENNCGNAKSVSSLNILAGDICKRSGNNNSCNISTQTDEILFESGDSFKTDQQGNCLNAPSIRIIRPSTDTVLQNLQPQLCMIDLSMKSLDVDSITASAQMRSSRSSSARSDISRFSSAHSMDTAIWTQQTVTTLTNRSLLLVSSFAVCFLPVSVVHVFSAYLSDIALINIYPLVCCIEYVYYAVIPILYVLTNKSLKHSTCMKKS